MATDKSPYGSIKFDSIETYHASVAPDIRAILEKLYQVIQAAAPAAEPVISYNMPAFKLHKVLVYYAAAKAHIGFYPTPAAIEAFREALQPYKTSKGAIQFPIEKALPVALIKKIVRYRVAEDKAKALLKK